MDLLDRGVDLGVMYREGRYWTLLTIIDGLPANSRLNEAILKDPDQVSLLLSRAAEKAERGEGAKSPGEDGPPLHLVSPEVEAIMDMRDSIEILIGTVAAANGGEYKPQFSKRPKFGFEEELERIRKHARERSAAPLIDALVPGYH